MTKSILVLKLGSASITTNAEIDEAIIADITRQVAELSITYHIILVSSGAVAAGKKFLKNYKGKITERKAAAAIGNPLLLGTYFKYFHIHTFLTSRLLKCRFLFAGIVPWIHFYRHLARCGTR